MTIYNFFSSFFLHAERMNKCIGIKPEMPLTQEGVVAGESRTIRPCYFLLLRQSSGVTANVKKGIVSNK